METSSRSGFLRHKVVIAMKSARIVQYLASNAVWWQEDEFALQQQQPLRLQADTPSKLITWRRKLLIVINYSDLYSWTSDLYEEK